MSRIPSPLLGRPTFVLVAASLVSALLLNARWLPIDLLAILLAIVLVRTAWRWRKSGAVPALLRTALIPLLGILVVQRYGNLFGRDAGSALLAAMLTIKLLETETRRDGRLLVMIAVFLSQCGFLFDQGPLQALLTAGVVLVVLIALRALALEPAAGGTPNRQWPSLGGAGVLRLLKLIAFALPFALVCFVLFPRLSSPMWGAPADSFADRRGLTDKVRPGQLGALALDDTPVFRASFQGPLPPTRERYFRAFVLWNYDGEEWTAGHNFFGTRRPIQFSGNPVDYEVVMEGTGQNWVPALDVVSQAPERTTLDSDQKVVASHNIETVESFQLRAYTRYQYDTDLDLRSRQRALRLPRSSNPQSRALAAQWQQQAQTPELIAQAALDLFHASFHYSFEPGPLPPRDAIDDFLYGDQTGYCEHFASAFTFLMRAAGVPARMVVGFQGGYFNSAGNYLTVRRADAHAWSEIWLPGRGWVRVDPTAAVAPERVDSDVQDSLAGAGHWYQRGWISGLLDRADVVRAAWNRAVVEFSALRQRNLARALGLDEHGPYGLVVLLVIGAFGALALAQWLDRQRGRHKVDPLLLEWRRLGRKLARLGISRARHEGPSDFTLRASHCLPEHAAMLTRLGEQFIELRYARRGPDPAEVAIFRRSVGRLKLRKPATK